MPEIQNILYQNLNDVGNAKMYMHCLKAMRDVAPESDSIFLILASQSMTNDMFTLLMKVLDKTRGSGSFWSLLKEDSSHPPWLSSEDLNFLKSAAKKLHHVRNKAHIHTDKQYAFVPNRAWHEASLSGNDLARTIDILFDSLSRKFQKATGNTFMIPDGNEADTKRAIRLISGKP